MLAGLFNLMIEKKGDRLDWLKKGLKSKQVKDKFTIVMNSIAFEPLVTTDFRGYIKLICEGDIYSHIATNLDSSFIKGIKHKWKSGYVDSAYVPSAGYKVKKYYKDLRSYCKILVLEYMYCSTESQSKRLKQIKRIYPNAVNKFIYDFKYCNEIDKLKKQGKRKRTKVQAYKIDRAKKLFSKFLQQMEAYLILDVITKEISEIYPEVFMATIHDSIIVPIEYQTEIKEFLNKRLFEIFNIRAEIKCEVWAS